MELKSGWNLPPGLMFIPEEKERVYDPECKDCHGTGVISIESELEVYKGACEDIITSDNTSTLAGAVQIAKRALHIGKEPCTCWESYDPGDCDPRNEYTGED